MLLVKNKDFKGRWKKIILVMIHKECIVKGNMISLFKYLYFHKKEASK